jgi:sugar/nucleoside kinase (ribokinase family)
LPFRITGGVVCAGNIVYDILVRPVDATAWGTTSWVESIEPHLGGNGANSSFTLAKLGVPVRLAGMVGPDSFGDRLLGMLAAVGVDTAYVARGAHPTATTVGLVNSSGARQFLHQPGCSREVFLSPILFTPEFMGQASHFHLANIFGLPGMRPLAPVNLRAARVAGLTTSLDTGWDARGEWMKLLAPCLPDVDLLFVNEDESRILSGSEDPRAAAKMFQAFGVANVVVKLGGEGCYVFTADGEVRAPAFRVPVVDTTGAGDCFAGAFLAALYHGYSIAKAARLANAVGALNIQRLGATCGLLPLAETVEWIKVQEPVEE